jgi:hypothetical protein
MAKLSFLLPLSNAQAGLLKLFFGNMPEMHPFKLKNVIENNALINQGK